MDTESDQSSAPEQSIVEIWTDGGCRPNPGPGGWGVLLRFKGVEREMSGGELETTNNRMELTAAAEALESLKRPCVVHLHTDSEYVRNGITRWHTGWVRRNWRNASGDPVANMDLWRRLLEANKRHDVSWFWVKGHSGVPENERVDELATQGRTDIENAQK
ncbi:MAG: ribonuclease HI [Acetobacter orientalis]|uniref:ribonuclease HI n=1 Tax=Acetobacter orientalis TaxID=146474 RepID=UPI0039E8B9F3